MHISSMIATSYPSFHYLYFHFIKSQVKVMHPSPGLENQWKWPTKINKIWYTSIIKKIEPPEPINCGRRTGVTSSFKFKENIQLIKDLGLDKFAMINQVIRQTIHQIKIFIYLSKSFSEYIHLQCYNMDVFQKAFV